jgi:hypothetical protein
MTRPRVPDEAVEDWIRDGYGAHERGEYARAAERYRAVLEARPAHKDALYLLGVLRMRDEAYAEAASLFERALRADAAVAAFQAGLGEALWRLGRHAEAAERFRAALALDPAMADARAGLATALQAAGRFEEAHAVLREWLEARLRARGPLGAAAQAAARPVPGTTLCCVDCRNYDLAADAIARTLARCRFERALFFTDAAIAVPGAETVRIDRIGSLEDYSRFMIKELLAYVATPFALVIQYDGYVLNGALWSQEFQRYDYVGARWPVHDGLDVGNGGFSLRSRRLLEALQDPEIAPLAPEDRAICRAYRALLERRHGIRFAPAAVADRFSFEALAPVAPTFGFHGVAHLFRLFDMSDGQIAAYRPEGMTLYEK